MREWIVPEKDEKPERNDTMAKSKVDKGDNRRKATAKTTTQLSGVRTTTIPAIRLPTVPTRRKKRNRNETNTSKTLSADITSSTMVTLGSSASAISTTATTTTFPKRLRQCFVIMAFGLGLIHIQLIHFRWYSTNPYHDTPPPPQYGEIPVWDMVKRSIQLMLFQSSHWIYTNTLESDNTVRTLVASEVTDVLDDTHGSMKETKSLLPTVDTQATAGSKTFSDASVECTQGSLSDDGNSMSNPLIPTFIIAGAQKSGTSALYYIFKIMQLSSNRTLSKSKNYQNTNTTTVSIHSSNKFEPHFFFRQMKKFNNQKLHVRDKCTLRQLYQQEFNIPETVRNQQNHRVISFEKSPIYICKPQIPSFIYQVVPWTKIILVLRNPIDRAFSHWKMDQSRTIHHNNITVHQYDHHDDHHVNDTSNHRQNDTNTTAMKIQPLQSFIQVIDEEVSLLRKLNLTTAPNVSSYIHASAHERQQYQFHIVQPLSERNCCGMHQSKTVNAYMYQYRKSMCLPLSRGMYAQQIYFWLHPYHGGIGNYRLEENIKIVPYEEFVQNRTASIQDILQYVGTMGTTRTTTTSNNTHNVMGALSLPSRHLDKDYSPGRYNNPLYHDHSHISTRTSRRSITTSTNSSTDDETLNPDMDPIVHEYLQKFYQPYNDELTILLGNRDWNNFWE
jgi:Sulfotransferase domain